MKISWTFMKECEGCGGETVATEGWQHYGDTGINGFFAEEVCERCGEYGVPCIEADENDEFIEKVEKTIASFKECKAKKSF